MWAQLITMSLKPGHEQELETLFDQLHAAEQPDSGLLRTLVLQRGRLLTHDALLEQVWGDGHGADTQILRTHMANLRRKIEPRDGARHIRTEHGVGYRLHGEPDGTPARVLRLVPADAGAAAPPIPRRRAA